jgi:hypothetical protein
MIVDETFRDLLNATFLPLIAKELEEPVPAPRALTNILEQNAPEKNGEKNLDRNSASHFATAAIDIWLRGVHSFLVSTALTETSSVWSSVSGYYSSHYVVRAFAHLLGYFQLFRIKKIAQLTHQDGQYICSFRDKKRLRGGEHQIYWRLVKATRAFEGDDLFTDNNQESEKSDVRHRNHANYSDHLFQYPNFFIAQEDAIKDRIDHISKIAIDTAPLPRIDKFPDLEYVQLIAYHRIVLSRRLLDDALEGRNKFWERHRTPDFAVGYMDFQLAEGAGLAQPIVQ